VGVRMGGLTKGRLRGVRSHLLAGLGVEVSGWDVSGCQTRGRMGALTCEERRTC
jgi:hypothetical protein